MNIDPLVYSQLCDQCKSIFQGSKVNADTSVIKMDYDGYGGPLGNSQKYMDKLPTVISCCLCCFLRAGSVCIAVASFVIGLILAPNVSHSNPPWKLGIMNMSNTAIESAGQMVLGVVSILLCIISLLLLVGALCNVPILIELYQWGAMVYCITTVMIYTSLSVLCFGITNNCFVAGFFLLFLSICNVLLTAYFVIVVNSLRMTMVYLNNSGITV